VKKIRMKNTGSPTLEDVAEAACVSTATISRSLNDPDKVAKETRERIQKAVDRLGYTPNFGGRVLASNRTNTVGAIIPSMANAMFASGLQAFQEVLAESGVTLLVASSGYDTEHEFRQIRSLMTHGADGLLLIGDERPQKTKDFLALRKIPYVISWCYSNNPDGLYVGFDNEKAAYKLTNRVLEFGHRDIAMIAGISKGNDRARNRIEGVSRAVRESADGARLTKIVEARYRLENGAEAFDEIMSASDLPTAIICGNDVLAAGAIVRARKKGVRVPDDVSITGFDDIGLASVVEPGLTTVRVPQIEMGQEAARQLLRLLSNQPATSSIEIETELVMRDSLAAPKALAV